MEGKGTPGRRILTINQDITTEQSGKILTRRPEDQTPDEAKARSNPCAIKKGQRLGRRGYLNSGVFRFYGFKPVHITAEDQPHTANAIRRASATGGDDGFIREPAVMVPQEGYC